MARGIYLDNSTTTRPSLTAVGKMMPFYNEMWGSPSSPHNFGNELLIPMKEAYKSIYELFGAKEEDTFVLTSSGAESVNQAVLSTYMSVTRATGKNQFITSHIEEAPAILSLNRLEHFDCVFRQVMPNSDGQITAEILSKAITPRTAMISLSFGNGLTGVINPIHEIAMLCKERGILLHLDVTHVIGKLYFEMADLGAHIITFNADQIHAPKGIGGLFCRSGTPLSPFIVGGTEQGGSRAGSFSVANLAALGQVAKEAIETRDLMCTEVARLRDKLEMGIVANYPEAVPFYSDQERLPHVCAIAFPFIASESLLYALNRKGLYACIGGGNFLQLSELLISSKVSDDHARTALSFSLSRETTEEEIDRAIILICDSAKKLRTMWS